MDAGTLRIALELIGSDLSGGAFTSFAGNILSLSSEMQNLIGVIAGAGAAFLIFKTGLGYAIEAGAALQQAGVMASIAISDGASHVNELESAIVALANTSQYKIADVDMAFRVLGGLGFTTGQILGGMGQEAIILAQAMGGPGAGISAADAAHLLGQSLLLFQAQGLTAKQAADELTGAFYNNMMSVSDLNEYMGMAGGTASSLGVSFSSLLSFGSMLTPMFGSASSAGASLAYMMRNLAHPATAAMAAEIQKLGLHVYDSQGKFVGLKSIMDQLFADTAGMTQQQKMDVFGTLFNVRSGRAAMDLMSQTQASFDATYNRIYGRITQVGQAQRDSNAINNSVIGTWNRLTTTLNDFFAKAGELIGVALLPLMNALNNLFGVLQQNPQVEKFLAIFLVVGTVLSGVALIVGVVAGAIAILGTGMAIAAGVFAGVIVVAAAVAGVFLLISAHTKQANAVLNGLHQALSVLGNVFGVVLGYFQAWITGFQSGFSWMGNFVGPLVQDVSSNIEQFGKDLSGIGQAGVQFMTEALKNLGSALKGLAPVWQDVLQLINFFGNVLGAVVGWIIGLLMPAIEGLALGFVALWQGLVAAITGAVTVIAGILQVLIGIFKVVFGSIIALVTGHPKQALKILEDGWNNIKSGVVSIIKGMAMAIVGVFTGLGGSILSAIGGFIVGIINWFKNLAEQLVGHSIVPDMINAIVQWFAGLPGKVIGIIAGMVGQVIGQFASMAGQALGAVGTFVGNVVNQVTQLPGKFMNALSSLPGQVSNMLGNIASSAANILGNMASNALQSGVDFCKNLASGIGSAAGDVGNAIGNIASSIGNWLGFSIPKEGPLHYMMEWMPHMMQNLRTGIMENMPMVEDAAKRVAGTISGAITPATTSVQTTSVMNVAQQQAGPAQQFTVPVQIDSKTVATAVFQVIGGQLRMNGMSRIGRG